MRKCSRSIYRIITLADVAFNIGLYITITVQGQRFLRMCEKCIVIFTDWSLKHYQECTKINLYNEESS